MKHGYISESSSLRNKAEELLKITSTPDPTVKSETDQLKLIHELEVHQIELTLKN
jgi:hypothetical protein